MEIAYLDAAYYWHRRLSMTYEISPDGYLILHPRRWIALGLVPRPCSVLELTYGQQTIASASGNDAQLGAPGDAR